MKSNNIISYPYLAVIYDCKHELPMAQDHNFNFNLMVQSIDFVYTFVDYIVRLIYAMFNSLPTIYVVTFLSVVNQPAIMFKFQITPFLLLSKPLTLFFLILDSKPWRFGTQPQADSNDFKQYLFLIFIFNILKNYIAIIKSFVQSFIHEIWCLFL